MVKKIAAMMTAIMMVLPFSMGTAREVMGEGIVAVVGDQAISSIDVRERIILSLFSAGIEPVAGIEKQMLPQALGALVEESLYLSDARKSNIKVTSTELKQALLALEQQNGLKPGQFKPLLQSQGVSYNALQQKIKAQITWNKILERKVRPKIIVTDREVEEKMEHLSSQTGVAEYDLSEIILPVPRPSEEGKMKALATKITQEIRRGKSFESLAKEFSRSTSAASGGRLGWVQQGHIAPVLLSVVGRLQAGEVSEPVRNVDAYHIVKIHEKRAVVNSKEEDTEVGIKHAYFPYKDPASAKAKKAALKMVKEKMAKITSCTHFAERAKAAGSTVSADTMMAQLKQLNKDIRSAVQPLKAGDVSPVIESAAGLHMFMVCERTEAVASFAQKEKIKAIIINRKMELYAKRYLQDLKRAAFIDIKI